MMLEEELIDLMTFCLQNPDSIEVPDKHKRITEIGHELFADGGVDALARGQMYTYELLQRYKNMFRESDLFFIMGSDNLKEFHLWKQPDKIFELANLVVFVRGNDDVLKIISSNPVLQRKKTYRQAFAWSYATNGEEAGDHCC